jgi:uncharacterized membrane protein YraQ (UPF0718 family)
MGMTGSADPGRANGRRRRRPVLPLLALSTIALLALAIAWTRGGSALAFEGIGEGVSLLTTVLPQLVVGFLLAGLLTVLLPVDVIATWLGEDSGLRGLVVATVAGMLTPGGPFLQFPLVASLANAGAGAGPLAAYLVSWSLIGMNRILVWEVPLLGAPFALTRVLVCLPIPFVVGLIVPVILRLVPRGS